MRGDRGLPGRQAEAPQPGHVGAHRAAWPRDLLPAAGKMDRGAGEAGSLRLRTSRGSATAGALPSGCARARVVHARRPGRGTAA